jgi:hypothetical protein
MHKCEICNNDKKFFQVVCVVCWSRQDHPAYYSKIQEILGRNADEVING